MKKTVQNETNEKMRKNVKKGKNESIKKKEKMKKYEKMKKNEKMEKNDQKRKKNGKNWIQTQNPLRFPRFTIVVILDDFHDFVSECVSFLRKINNPLWGVIVFPKKSDNFHWT